MNIVHFTFAFLLAVLAAALGHVSPVSESFYACLAESNLTKAQFIETLKSNDTEVAQCIASCTMEKEKFMTGEQIHENAIIKKMAEVSQEIGREAITYLVKVCAEEARELKGKCGVAHSVVRCIHDSLLAEGWI
ncbi:hypothetical protein TKK_0000945 [Trichogramma kaykai]